jgi:mRNA interferase RelE/StbE
MGSVWRGERQRVSGGVVEWGGKGLRKLPATDRARISAAVEALSGNPRPYGVDKVVVTGEYRIRVGDYRVRYSIDDGAKTVTVSWAGQRKDAYNW